MVFLFFPVLAMRNYFNLQLNVYKAMQLEWNNLMQLYRLELIVLIAALCKKNW